MPVHHAVYFLLFVLVVYHIYHNI